jgi:hypothetical protein
MPTLTFPAIKVNSVEWGLRSNTQISRSDLNGAVQTLALPGDTWVGTLTFTNKLDPDARILRAFITSLRGQAGRFYLSPPGYRRAGIGTGTPLVKGAAQTGSTITTDGWGANQTAAICAGDYFQIGTELKMCTADTNTNGVGEMIISFVPPIRVAPADNAAIVITSPKAIMMLQDAKQARWQVQPTPIYAAAIAVEEALT